MFAYGGSIHNLKDLNAEKILEKRRAFVRIISAEGRGVGLCEEYADPEGPAEKKQGSILAVPGLWKCCVGY